MQPDHERAFLEALQTITARTPEPLSPESDKVETQVPKEETYTAELPAPPSTVTAANLWRHPDAHPLVLDLALLRRYGPEWLGWEAATLRHRIPLEFKTPSVSELNIAKIQACRTLHLVDSFWERWEVFVACLLPFNGEFPDFRVMHAPTVAQCLVAADIANRIREDVEWSSEMKAYFKTVYHHDGVFLPLPPLDFVQLDVPEEIDEKELAQKWPAVRQAGRPPKGDTFVDEQLRRLLTVNGYLEESRERLRQQERLHV
jgi:hypothetical protein